LLNRNSYDESDFHVDPVPNDMELSPEILAQLQNSNGEINFGANENTIDTFKQSAVGSEGQTEAQQKIKTFLLIRTLRQIGSSITKTANHRRVQIQKMLPASSRLLQVQCLKK
jgi:hypothetical protein